MATDPTTTTTTTIPEPVPDTVAVWVPQPGGEIQIASAGDAAVVHTVREHIVDVLRDAVQHFLRSVPGALLHDPAAAAPPEGEPPDHQTPEAAAAEAAGRDAQQPEGASGPLTTSSRPRAATSPPAAPTAPDNPDETAPKPGA